MAYATNADVAVRWARELSTEEEAQIDARLEDVERMILRKVDLDGGITDGSIDLEDVKQVESDAVLRLVRNPDGYIQETDGDYSYMLSQEAAAGKLKITDDEWASLGYRRKRIFTIAPSLEMPT